MEAMAATKCLAICNLKWHFSHPNTIPCGTKNFSTTFAPSNLLRGSLRVERRQDWRLGSKLLTKASASEDPSVGSSEKWVLEPVGDGDFKHIGYKVSLPSAFEIVSDVVTVGRLPEKASMVIPVATVSGIHAKLEKKQGSLLVTDLDSTNGTFINEKKLIPGSASEASPGSLITFGDTHLAIFRVSKVEDEISGETDETVEAEVVKQSAV